MKVTEILNAARTAYKVYPHAEVHDAQHLAEALRIPGRNVAKTVMLYLNHGYECFVVVLPATEQVDLQRVSEFFGGASVRLATQAEIAARCPDCEYGVLPPFGSHFGMKTIVDESLTQHEDLFFQGDNRREAIRLTYHDYYNLAHPLVASIAQAPATSGASPHATEWS